MATNPKGVKTWVQKRLKHGIFYAKTGEICWLASYLFKPLKSKHSLDFLVTIFSFHSIFSQGKLVDTDLGVTDFRVTVFLGTLRITIFAGQGKRSH